jgi:hypothetical protein
MVRVANIFTAILAGATIANASQHAKQSSETVGAPEVKAAVESFATLLGGLAANIGAAGEAPSNADLKAGIDTFMNIMASVRELQEKPGNATAFTPNWEGAALGAAVASIFGGAAGAILGAYTDWTYKGFHNGLTQALGFDPIAVINGQTPPKGA